jgi:1,4-dihydroxy-2-naphthoyl-CoA hydrolase
MLMEEAVRNRLTRIPIFKTLKLRVGDLAEGIASLTASYDPAYDNVFNAFHGGLLMTLADNAAFIAVLTVAGADAIITTTDMNIRFLAPCRTDAIAKAMVIKFGRTLCPVSVDVHDLNRVRVAVAQVTYMRLGGPSGKAQN